MDDDGAGPAGDATEGTGLTGMRERARSTGGTLEAGPGPERGFRVHARLPTSVPGEPPDGPAGGGPGDGTAEPAPPPATARGDGRVDR